ncbi:MAG: putative toxin-antitoxin system toxin component, PIN family [Treponema sp.]|nr:putative toxin-antitoxin system toxin component, PIN family [Treponema sp.]MBR5645179.1 putative toxin-antitoxin system toxin component, PIN family [Treponema sp.]
MKQKIVIDTNVILSALQSNKGKSFELISKIGNDLFDFALSVPLVLEYEAILKSHLNKTIFTDSDINDFIDYLCAVGIKTKIFYLWRPYLKDPFDDHVLEVAINSNADAIVTYNKKDFQEAQTLGMKILTPKEFLDEMQEV